jgi:YidC/Oxa1 family membrane protein insertase
MTATAPAKKSRLSSTLEFVALFAIAYLLSHFLLGNVMGGDQKPAVTGVTIAAMSVSRGNSPELTITNGTQSGITLTAHCPTPAVDIFKVTTSGSGQETLSPLRPTDITGDCPTPISIAAGGNAKVSLGAWKYSLFNENATFEAKLPESLIKGQTGSGQTVARFEIYEPNGFIKLFRTFITQPFLNLLVGIAAILPDHNLGIAIIVLTILVKLLLFLPTQHALEGQRKMQVLQPKINAMREQFKDDPTRMQKEMLALWKEHKVNPFQSCLPLLVQFPILIGLLYVIRDGSHLEFAKETLYPFFQHINWDFSPFFLGLDLRLTSWIMAPILVALQFGQMWLTFHHQKRKKAAEAKVIDAKTGKPAGSPEEMQQKVMLYAMPVMIGFFALQFPAAVSLYWGISTLFAIGQQIVVNRKVK